MGETEETELSTSYKNRAKILNLQTVNVWFWNLGNRPAFLEMIYGKIPMKIGKKNLLPMLINICPIC